MPLAATIPASCLQYHNPSWSLSLSESPSVFIFPLERELSSPPGRGRSCHPPSDGWLFMATRPPGPFSPRHKPAPKDRQSDKREGLAGEWSLCQIDAELLGLPEHSQTPTQPSKKTAHTAPALPEFLPLRGCLSACPPMTSTSVFCSQYISQQSREPGKVGGTQVPQGADPRPGSEPP